MDDLTKNIQLWLTYDNKISEVNKYNKNLKEKKQYLETTIIDVLKTHNLENKDIKINNFKLNVNNNTTPSSLTLKIVEQALTRYLDENTKTQILNNITHLRNLNKKTNISLKKKILKNKSNKKTVK